MVIRSLLFWIGLLGTCLADTGQPQTVAKDTVGQLTRHITSAQLKKFREEYSMSQCSCEAKNQLLEHAIKSRAALQKKLKNMGREDVNHPVLAGGILQSAVGLWALLNTIIPGALYIFCSDNQNTTTVLESPFMYTAPSLKTALYFLKYGKFETSKLLQPAIAQQHTRLLAGVSLTTLVFGLITAAACTSGFTTITQALNYKKMLREKIKSLDEIIALLQSQDTVQIQEKIS